MSASQPQHDRLSTRNLFNLVRDVRLGWHLLRDGRVPVWTKFIPALSLLYLIWPIDFLADPILGLGQMDDLAVIWLGLKAFIAVASSALGAPADVTDRSDVARSDEPIEGNYRVLS